MSYKLDEIRKEVNKRTVQYDKNELETKLLESQRASRNKKVNNYIRDVMSGKIESEIPNMREFIKNTINRGNC
ncbi:hypothetical protein [Intestinibacter bartlettii]|uniref:hypothetical protein n=1 Tax=Intestinibacter bartlettii TaxID=261299 RepID=UPI0008233C25|nr:hypothetical protein [Intestinibacter bartlettii]SCI52294.1 Uncharacterised protein [uncultured Clostridium sp.]DAK61914.1 MAG TPA: hypothetical protein [Caudoviricetes sp.]DAS35800.1 MAG TPA: hypothetical protein [Caudoviricetes sp.]